VTAIASLTIALRRAGADWLTVASMAASALLLTHPAPTGTVGRLVLFHACYGWDRRQPTAAVEAAMTRV
jgi:hypothetical protein